MLVALLWGGIACLPIPSSGQVLDDFAPQVSEAPVRIQVNRKQCNKSGVYVQVLGSGSTDVDDVRGAPGYLVWQDGRARVLIDTGPGTSVAFARSGADFRDLLAVLISQVQVDHSGDLPALLQGSEHIGRTEPLPVYGPAGNSVTPGINDWVDLLLGAKGAYRHLAHILSPLSFAGYKLVPYQVNIGGRKPVNLLRRDGIDIMAISTDNGETPALAFRVGINGTGITFTGDTANEQQTIKNLTASTAILVTHHVVPEHVRGAMSKRHMSPSQIGRLAAETDPNMIILSHRGRGTLGLESQSRARIREHFKGLVIFADDQECWGV